MVNSGSNDKPILTLTRNDTITRLPVARLPYVFMVAIIHALVISLTVTALLIENQQQQERARVATQNIAHLLEQHLSDVFDKVNVVLQAIAFHYHEHLEPAQSGVSSLNSYLEKQKSLLPEISSIQITDRDGVVNFGQKIDVANPVSLADRDFFIRTKDEPAVGLIISGPVFDRISQQWIIVIAHRLNTSDGTFAGVVFASIATTHFENVLSSLSLGEHGAATIRTTDLALVHRYPDTKGAVGSKEVSQQLRDHFLVKPDSGEYTAVTKIDGIERANAYRRLNRYPFYVLVGLATEDFIDEWQTHILTIVGLAGLTLLVVVFSARRLYRSAQRHAADESDRRRVREQDAVLNSNVLGIAVVKDQLFTWCNLRFAGMLGYEPNELIGQSARILFLDDDDHAAFTQDVIPMINAGQQCKLERQYRRKDGTLSWFEICGQRIHTAEPDVIWAVADIADRKQTEHRLRESEARFRAIFENIDAISIQGYRPDRTVTYWNNASEKLYGYTPTEAIGRNLLDLIIPVEMHARVNEAMAWMFEQKQGIPAGRLQLRHKNGNPIHVYSSHTVIEDIHGNLTLFCLDVDQTEQVHMEETLRERERFIDAVVEHAGNAIVVLDEAGRIVRFNQAAEALSGYGFNELDGKPIWDYLIPPERQDDVRTVFDKLIQDRLAGSHENEWVMKDGRRRLLHWRNTILRDAAGRVTHVVALGYDITQVRHNEQELETYRKHLEHLVNARTAEAEAARLRTQLILDSSADGIIELDARGNVLMSNPAASSILGYLPEDLLGRNVHDAIHYRHTDGSPYPASECAVVNAVIAGRTLRLDNDVFWHANGQPVPVAVATHPIWQDNRVSGAVMSFFDNTERNKVEQSREEARQVAEQLANIKSEFLANMSHEIRTPLNGVLGMAQIGYRDSIGRDKAQETFARILDSGNLLLTIINDILDFSKIEAGKLNIESFPFDPAHVTDKAISLLEGSAANKSINLIGENAVDLPTACLGDSVRISQVLLNLLSNAIKFTSAGEVRLSVHREGDQLIFEVADSGIGIPPEHIERLFMPFEQADGSITRKFGGTGLGLAISRRLAEMMGGSLTATSEVGKGSTFTLRLPLRETDQPVQRGIHSNQRNGKRLPGLRILVAEDNTVNQIILDDVLRREGAEVEIVDNGQLAVEAVIQGKPFDVVLMDVQMPVMDGLEATRKLQQIAPALPVIGQTAHAMKEEHNKCLAAGMVATITKPIDADILVAIMLDHMKSADIKPTVPVLIFEGLRSKEDQIVDWSALSKRYSDRPEFIDRLVAMTLQGHEKDAEKLRVLINSGDLSEIGNMAHALTGLAGNMSAPELGKAAIRAMNATKIESPEALATTQVLANEVERFIEEVRHGRPA